MRAFLAVLLLTALVLSGCASKGGDDDGTDASSSSSSSSASKSASTSGTGTKSTTTTSTAKTNHAPTGTLATLANGTGVKFTLNGTDPDGDALSWSLIFGDGNKTTGTSLPAILNHTFKPGNYTAVYNLTDGKLSVSYNATLAVKAAAAGGAGLPITYTFTGTASGAHEPAATGAGTGADLEHKFAVVAGTTSIHALLKWTPYAPGATDLDLYINDAGGKERGSSACSNFMPVPDPGFFSCNRAGDEEATLTGIGAGDVGEWVAIVSPFEAPNISYTLTIDLA